MKKAKKVAKTDLRKKVSTQAELVEAALDHVEKLQIENYQLKAELADCEGRENRARPR